MPVAPLLDADLAARHVVVRARDVVYVKGILEASEGVGVLFGQAGGELTLATPHSRAAALDRLLADLKEEMGAELTIVEAPASRGGHAENAESTGIEGAPPGAP